MEGNMLSPAAAQQKNLLLETYGQINEHLVTQMSIGNPVGEIFELGTDASNFQIKTFLKGRLFKQKGELALALEKVKMGTYGICEDCGKKISGERLEVLPATKYCASCQKKLEDG